MMNNKAVNYTKAASAASFAMALMAKLAAPGQRSVNKIFTK
jgi:hypothetical protein